MNEEAPIEYPIDGILDLHHFDPRELNTLLEDYLLACKEKGIYRIRIIHGKGSGILRKRVHAWLSKCPYVKRFHPAEDASSWGASIAYLQ